MLRYVSWIVCVLSSGRCSKMPRFRRVRSHSCCFLVLACTLVHPRFITSPPRVLHYCRSAALFCRTASYLRSYLPNLDPLYLSSAHWKTRLSLFHSLRGLCVRVHNSFSALAPSVRALLLHSGMSATTMRAIWSCLDTCREVETAALTRCHCRLCRLYPLVLLLLATLMMLILVPAWLRLAPLILMLPPMLPLLGPAFIPEAERQ